MKKVNLNLRKNLSTLFFILSIALFVSCSSKDDNTLDVDNNSSQQINDTETHWKNMFDLNNSGNYKGLITYYFQNQTSWNHKSINENKAFKIISLEKSFLKMSDKEKNLLIQNQLNISNNLPNINEFYDLLASTKNFQSQREMHKIGNDFFGKNLSLIEKIQWRKAEDKESKKQELIHSFQNFLKKIKAI